jgi:glycosyltransferase involved in cell wall biosynthesis
MRIAMLAPISWRVPPRHYGPWEQVVSLLTEGLVDRGIDVTLFATADSITQATLSAVCPRPYSEDPTIDPKVWECLHIAEVFERADEFDIVHNHFDFLPLSYSRLVDTPVVSTIHGFSSDRILPVYEKYDGHVHYVAISDADRSPRLHYTATIHHGIRIDEFPFHGSPEGYLLFFGRITEEKGTAEAIALAQQTGQKLVIAGIIQDQGYFDREVAPHVDGKQILYLGSVGPDRRGEILGGAAALVHLINFDEPFGLSVVEAMACGTPVLACPRGSMPELIEPGVNGYLVSTVEEAAAALDHVAALDRRAIRRSAEKRFSVDRMVDDYIVLYHTILERHPKQ